MNINEAEKVVRNIGWSYFYDELDRKTVDEIIEWIRSDIIGTHYLSGLSSWEDDYQCFLIILREYQVQQLDQILLKDYALAPDDVEGSKAFFERISMTMGEALRIARERLSK
jgi:hypothetical protein